MTTKDNNLTNLDKSHIAKQCVCCGSLSLKSSPAILMPFVAHRVFGWGPVEIDDSWGLMTINNGTAYSICKSLLCCDCGLLFLDIRFSDSELNNLYNKYREHEYTTLREHYEPGYTIKNNELNNGITNIKYIEDFLEPYLEKPLSILDWGGDTGKNTPFKFEKNKIDIYDIGNKPTLEGITVVNKKEALSKKYSLVICCNVLEHTPYPSDILIEIAKAMDTSTILYIEVPNENLLIEHNNPLEKKKHWHEHINFFSEKSLINLLQKTGFSILKINNLKIMTDKKTNHIFQIVCCLKKFPIS
jgi:hypothetical protein